MMRSVKASVTPLVEEILGQPVKGAISSDWWAEGRLREDFYASWIPKTEYRSPQLMLVVNPDDVLIGLYGSSHQRGGRGFSELVTTTLQGHEPEGVRWMGWGWYNCAM